MEDDMPLKEYDEMFSHTSYYKKYKNTVLVHKHEPFHLKDEKEAEKLLKYLRELERIQNLLFILATQSQYNNKTDEEFIADMGLIYKPIKED